MPRDSQIASHRAEVLRALGVCADILRYTQAAVERVPAGRQRPVLPAPERRELEKLVEQLERSRIKIRGGA